MYINIGVTNRPTVPSGSFALKTKSACQHYSRQGVRTSDTP